MLESKTCGSKVKSGGRHNFANFGQYMPINYFRAFQCAAALMFSDESHWFKENRDKPWEIFLPCLESYNMKRRNLFQTVLLMLDESMSGWRPKTSKLGGLPNITFEPRKPIPLGTMMRNSAECLAGCIVYQDVVQAPELQQKKDFFYSDFDGRIPEITSLPGSGKQVEMSAHTAEVLRLVKGAGVCAGGWTGGDAWFGSIMSSVELMKRLGVHSTFVIKNNTNYFPMAILHSILTARHKNRPAGHWVVMKTFISDVKVLAIAYAWSQKGVSYFVSTCGSTVPSPFKYESKFEDEWGLTNFKEIERPDIVHMLYEYLPLIDEHNKQRQSLLQLERRWLTKDPWFRLVTTIIGMSVVDFHRYYRHHTIKLQGRCIDEIDNIRITKFTDLMCGNLLLWKYTNRGRKRIDDGGSDTLDRIRDDHGNTTRPLTQKQIQAGKTVGTSISYTCYICRRYLNEKGCATICQTSFWCKNCHMPLCHVDRRQSMKRTETCIEEHLQSSDVDFGCTGPHPKKKIVPADKMINLHNKD
jgi:hypothetical protein